MADASCQVSVVIPTHNRSRDCVAAAESALRQEPGPLEVLVCDDGSTDDTATVLAAMQTTEPRLRYLRLTPGRGTPGPARNLGIAEATGEWIGLLDDDDRWLPGKLAAQLPHLLDGTCDVVASDALRSDGSRYFGPLGGSHRPDRAELGRHNPLIISTAIVRRASLLEAGGFDETRRMKSVADYDIWLRLADHGARFLVLDDALIRYEDDSAQRLSAAVMQTQMALVTLLWRRWRSAPSDRVRARALLREALATAPLAARSAVRRADTR